jgi:cell division septum initiation protein DivIVA
MYTPEPTELPRELLQREYETAIRDNERLRRRVKERDRELDDRRHALADALGVENAILRLKFDHLVKTVVAYRERNALLERIAKAANEVTSCFAEFGDVEREGASCCSEHVQALEAMLEEAAMLVWSGDEYPDGTTAR